MCAHPARPKLDVLIASGESLRTIADDAGVSKSALWRHRAHIPAQLAEASKAADVASADTTLVRIGQLEARAHKLLDKAERKGDLKASAAFVRELRSLCELLARVRGELREHATTNTTVNVLAITSSLPFQAVLRVLERHPTAHAEVLRELQALPQPQATT